MKRLQDQGSVYNVYDWEHDRKKQVKIVKSICYHNPNKLIGSRRKSTRRGAGFESAKNEPNRQLFELYQNSLRASVDPMTGLDGNSMIGGGPMSGEASDHKKGQHQMGSATGLSTEMGTTTLPEVQPNSSKNAQAFSQGYATHQAHEHGSNVPRFGG